jgi:ATP-dependent DNA helicase RecQ
VIVYAATRRRVETLAAGLRDAGLPAEHFHGTLARKRREELTAHFHTGELRVVVATSAFGLGIDKPDVRLVVHADPPEDLESLYQQVGRAGRDGEPARGVMVARPSGYGLPHFFAARSDTRHEDLRAVLKAVGTQPIRVSDLGRQSQLSAPRVRRAVNALLGVGAIREERVGLRRAGSGTHDAAVIDEAMAAGERRTARAETGVELVRRYAETDDCRRRLVLQLLGEQVGAPCGNCDNCDAGLSRPATEMETEIGSVVHHPEFGRGTVQQIETDRVVILFDEVGYRTLSLQWAEEHRLLDEETA